jgi:hypothetical protein
MNKLSRKKNCIIRSIHLRELYRKVTTILKILKVRFKYEVIVLFWVIYFSILGLWIFFVIICYFWQTYNNSLLNTYITRKI